MACQMPRRQVRQSTPGQVLRAARGERTQEDMARLLDVGLRTWQRWEKDDVRPGAAQVFRIADELGLDPRDLIEREAA
jgi:transcriptional regulator with XRE-family HTH domain